jgi:DNA primase
MEEEWASNALAAVFSHYNLGSMPHGERSMRCPVHDDAHASASVNGGKGVWHCHACGNSGNAMHIVMNRESLDYKQALQFVENLVGGKPVYTATNRRTKKTGTRWVPPRLRNSA